MIITSPDSNICSRSSQHRSCFGFLSLCRLQIAWQWKETVLLMLIVFPVFALPPRCLAKSIIAFQKPGFAEYLHNWPPLAASSTA